MPDSHCGNGIFRFGADGADDDDALAAGFGVDADDDAFACEEDTEDGRGTGVLGLLIGVAVVDGTFFTGADVAATPFAGNDVVDEDGAVLLALAPADPGLGLAVCGLEDEAC